MKLKDYLLTQAEYDEFCDEYDLWCEEQTAKWGYEPADCQMDKDTAAGYRLSGILGMDGIPDKMAAE
jgi:hypothetical protein